MEYEMHTEEPYVQYVWN